MKPRNAMLSAAVMLAAVTSCSKKEAPAPVPAPAAAAQAAKEPLNREEMQVVEVRSTVQKVDLKKREVTLKDADGRVGTIKVGDEVQRLNEIKPGDTVVVKYFESLAFEVREPSEAERANPAEVLLGAAKAEAPDAPGAGVVGSIHTIVTIEKINRKAGTVTVKGPGGKVTTVKAQYPENLDKVKVGDTIAVTYTEALAIQVEPVAKSSSKKK